MDSVKAFNAELTALYEQKPPISKAKMTSITRGAIKAIKFYKHVVQSVEKFIQKCKPEYKVPGLYVIDSIVRQSRHQFGAEKDVFAPRFAKNMQNTFIYLFRCPPEDKSKVIRVLNLWQKNSVFQSEIIQPLFDLTDPNHPIHKEHAAAMAAAANSNGGLASLLSLSVPIVKTPPSSRTPTKTHADSSQSGWQSEIDLASSTILQLSGGQTMSNLTVKQLQVSGQLATGQTVDPNFIQQLQQIQQMLIKQQQDNAAQQEADQVKFDKKLLDFDYGSDDDDDNTAALSPKPHTPSSGLENILSNPEVMRHLHNLQQQMSQQQHVQQAEMEEKMRKLQEMKQQEEEFDKHLAMAVPNLPFASECDLKPPPENAPSTHRYDSQFDQHKPVYTFPMMDITQPPPGYPPSLPPQPTASQEMVEQGDSEVEFVENRVENDTIEVINLLERSRSRSPANLRHKRRRSRSKSRDYRRGRRSRSRSISFGGRSTSRTKRRRSRSRDRDREKEQEKEKDREKERERKKKGLPQIKAEHLSVCSTTLWVGHLSKLVQQEDLSDTFGAYGDIVSIDLIPPRGCAFICMNRRQDANRALTKLKNFKLQGKAITIAWAPGKGVKGKEWKDYWEVDLGVSYIPWTKLSRDASDLDVVEEGGVVDEDTVPDYLKAAQVAYRAQQPMPTGSADDNLLAPGFIPLPEGLPVATSVRSVDTSQPPPSGSGLLPPPGSMGPMVPPPFAMGNVSRLLPPMGMPMGPGMMGNVPMGVPPPGMQGLLMPPGGQMMHQQMMPPPGNPPFGMMNHHGPLSQIPLPGPVAPQDKPNTGLPHNPPPMGVPPPTSEASLPGLSEAMLRVPFGAPPPFVSQHNDDSMEMEMEEEQLKTNKGFPAQIRLSDQLMAAIRGQGPFSHQMSMPPPPLQMPTLDQPPKDNRDKDKEGGDAQGRREGRRDRDDRAPNDRDRDRDRGRDRDRDRDRNRWGDRDRDRDRRDRDRDRERDRENRDRDSRGGRSLSQNNEDQTSKGGPWNNNQESQNKPSEKLSLSERLRILAEGGTLSNRDENKPDSRKDRNENRDAKSENRTENRNENRNDRSENRTGDRKDSRNDNRSNRNQFGGRDSRGGRRDRSESSEPSKERDSSTPKNTGSQNAPPSLLDLPKMCLPEGLSQASTDRNPPASSPGGSRPMFPRVQAGGAAPSLLHGPGPEGFRVPGGDGFGNFRPVGPGEAMRPPFGPHGGPPEGMLSTPLLDRRPHDREGFDPRSHPRDMFDSEEFDLPPRRPEFDPRPDEFPPREFGPRGPPMGDEFGPPRGPPMGDDFGSRGPPMGEEFGPPRGPPMNDDFGPPRGPPRGDEFDILPLRPEDFDPRGPHPEDFDPRGPPRFDPRGPPRDGFPHPDGFDPRGSRPDFDPRSHPDFFPPHGPDGFGPRGMMGPPRRMGPDGFGPRPMMRGPGPMFPHGPPGIGMPSPGPRPGMWMDNQGPPMFPPRGFEGQPGEEEFFGRAPPPFDEMDHRGRDGPRGNWEPRGPPSRRGPAFRDAPRRPGRGGPDEEKEDDEVPSKADRRRSRWSNASPMAEDAPLEESAPPTERSESVTPSVEHSVPPSKESTEANTATERSPPHERVSTFVEESQPVVHESRPHSEEDQPLVEESRPFTDECSSFVEESQPVVEESHPVVEESHPVVEESQPFIEESQPFIEESQPFVEESQPFVKESQPFVEECPTFVEETQSLVEENQHFSEESQPFEEESQSFVESSLSFIEESQPYVEESQPYVEESTRLEQESEVIETSAGDSTPCNDEPRESEPILASAVTTEAIADDLE